MITRLRVLKRDTNGVPAVVTWGLAELKGTEDSSMANATCFLERVGSSLLE